MNHYSHIGEILPVRGVTRPVPPGGILFPFDYGFYGMGNGRIFYPLEGHVATIRPGEGRFGGGAVAVEEGTTNIVPDTDMTSSSWTKEEGFTVEKLSETLYGMPVYRVTFLAGRLSRTFFDFGYQDGEWFSGSIYYKFVSGHEAQEAIPAFYFRETGFGTAYKRVDFQRVTSWQRIELNHQFSGSGSSMFLLYRAYSDTQTDVVMDFAMPQLEKKPFATSFVAGTRADGILSFPVESFPQGAFTFSCWLKATGDNGGNSNKRILSLGPSIQNSRLTLWLYRPTDPNDHRRIIAEFGNNDSGVRQYRDLTSATPWSTNEYEFFAVTFDGANTFKFYRNGELWHQYSPSKINSITEFALRRSNWLIDELLILPYAATQEEILSWYHADAPMVEPTIGTVLAVAL